MVIGKFFVGRHYLHEGKHAVEEMLPDVADHQIGPGFWKRDRLLPIGTIEGIGSRRRVEWSALRIDPEIKDV